MGENKIVWGVGRGSSVSSYILYLLGVHKVNSIKYGLNITDFLIDAYEVENIAFIFFNDAMHVGTVPPPDEDPHATTLFS